MPTAVYVILSRLRAILTPSRYDEDFDQELESHIAMAEEDGIRRGLPPETARREALVNLGGMAQLREAGRAARGFAWMSSFGLDLKLGIRMLRKSWGLSLIGGVAMALALPAAFLET